MDTDPPQRIPGWLQALVGLASICVIAATVAFVVIALVILPGAANEAEDDINARLEELIDSLGGDLREMLNRIDDLDDRLRAVRDLLNEINIRDAEAQLEARLAEER